MADSELRAFTGRASDNALLTLVQESQFASLVPAAASRNLIIITEL